MRPTVLIILALALLSAAGIAYAKCPRGTSSMLVPAVTGETSQMLVISVESLPGKGEIFMSTAPYVGMQTQNSERIAVSVATGILEVDPGECNFLFRIGGDIDETEAVDGPSAGAAMTLSVLSALGDTPIPNTVSMTGTIEPDGSVGPVGSVSAKAEAAAKEGSTLFLTPKLEMYERLLLSGVRKKYEMRVIEVRDIYEAAAIVLGGEIPAEENRTYRGTELPENLTQYEIMITPQVARFAAIANSTFEDTAEEIKQAMPRGNGEFDGYFDGELNSTRRLLGLGYYYTGANIAFLTGVDASLVGRQATGKELNRSLKEVGQCLAGVRKPGLHEDNFEEVFGGEARRTWARMKLDDVYNMSGEGEEIVIYKLRELEYAKGWCTLADRLFGYGGAGKRLDEAMLRGLAKEKLEEARAIVSGEETDSQWHIEAAEKAYGEGNYGAALYDSAYAIGMSAATAELVDQTPVTLKKRVDAFVGEEVGGLWPNLYKMQVKYYSESGSTDLATGFRMAVFVKELARTNDAAKKKLLEAGEGGAVEGPAAVPAKATAPPADEGSPALTASTRDAIAIIAIFGLLLVIAYELGEVRGGKRAPI